jgi:hypothetical protein
MRGNFLEGAMYGHPKFYSQVDNGSDNNDKDKN